MCARIVKIHTIRIRALESVENSLFIWFRKKDFYFASIKFISILFALKILIRLPENKFYFHILLRSNRRESEKKLIQNFDRTFQVRYILSNCSVKIYIEQKFMVK